LPYLENEKKIAVDMEADSMFHFREKVCLIQISTSEKNYLIDPLAFNNLSNLGPVFADHKIEKIFHGADYDIRSLHRDFDIEVNNLFDTQIACRFLGFHETGLEAVLHKEFGICLNKKYQKKDWSIRPLPREMLEYGMEDTCHLIPLTKNFQKKLKKLGRLSWVREECEILSKVRYTNDGHIPLFLKFKGAGRLKPRELAILENLLRLRTNIARKKDRPLFKILGNNTIMRLVELQPSNIRQIIKSNALSKKQIKMYGNMIVEKINEAKRLPSGKLPVFPKTRSPKIAPEVPERIQCLKKWRDKKAKDLRIDPALICTKSIMTTPTPIRIAAAAS
jgi:ribonuclease D